MTWQRTRPRSAGRSGGTAGRPPRAAAVYRRRRIVTLAMIGLTVAAIVAVVAGGGGTAVRPPTRLRGDAAARGRTPTPARSPVAARRRTVRTAPAGPYAVGMTELTLAEPSPAASATGTGAAGEPVRALPMVVRYPATGPAGPAGAGAGQGAAPARSAGPFPLVVFSQGYDISAEAYAALLDAWARAGYIVVDPTYPRTDPSAPGPIDESDIVHHPGDLRFVIGALTAAARDSRSALRGLIAPHETAVVGHSDGGDVSLAVATNSCCADTSVQAAVILSGAQLSAFGGRYDTGRSVPLLVVQGSADTINVPACSVQLYDQARQPKYYLEVPGAEHEPPYLDAGPIRTGVVATVLAFLNAYLKHERAAPLSALARPGALPAGETLTSGAAAPRAAGAYCPGAP